MVAGINRDAVRKTPHPPFRKAHHRADLFRYRWRSRLFLARSRAGNQLNSLQLRRSRLPRHGREIPFPSPVNGCAPIWPQAFARHVRELLQEIRQMPRLRGLNGQFHELFRMTGLRRKQAPLFRASAQGHATILFSKTAHRQGGSAERLKLRAVCLSNPTGESQGESMPACKV